MLHIHVVWESAEEGKEGELRHQPAGKSNAKGYKKVIRKCLEGNRKLGGSNMKGIRVYTIINASSETALLPCLTGLRATGSLPPSRPLSSSHRAS